jgi:glycosyltransferase involved in cell wall biosynthesis
MKIVMIGPFAFKPKSTVSIRTFFMARALVKAGHQVTILMPPYDNIADSGRRWEQDGVRMENMVLTRDDLCRQITVPVRMARRAAGLDPDVIHVFKPIGYSGLAGIYVRRFSKRPLVLDTDDWEGRGGWADINPYPKVWQRFFDWQEHWLARHADAVTVVSHVLKRQVISFGANPKRVVYLPNGPDTMLRDLEPVSEEQKAAVRSRLGVGDAPMALYLGNVPHGTDLDLALEAMVSVGERLPQARLVIAGIGGGLEGLRQRAQQLELSDRVVFPGWVDHDQAPMYVSAADVAVNPYRDTLINRSKCAGKVILAMALGTPVVTARLGENVAYIQDGQSGLLSEPGDVQDLARVLVAALSDPAWAAELGRHGQQRIWSAYDWDRRVALIEGAYSLALEERTHRR